jgi:hypothetical protein
MVFAKADVHGALCFANMFSVTWLVELACAGGVVDYCRLGEWWESVLEVHHVGCLREPVLTR